MKTSLPKSKRLFKVSKKKYSTHPHPNLIQQLNSPSLQTRNKPSLWDY